MPAASVRRSRATTRVCRRLLKPRVDQGALRRISASPASPMPSIANAEGSGDRGNEAFSPERLLTRGGMDVIPITTNSSIFIAAPVTGSAGPQAAVAITGAGGKAGDVTRVHGIREPESGRFREERVGITKQVKIIERHAAFAVSSAAMPSAKAVLYCTE